MKVKTWELRVGTFSLSDICSWCPDTISSKKYLWETVLYFCLYQLLFLLLVTVPLSFLAASVETPISTSCVQSVQVPLQKNQLLSSRGIKPTKSFMSSASSLEPKVIAHLPLIFSTCNIFISDILTSKCFLVLSQCPIALFPPTLAATVSKSKIKQ